MSTPETPQLARPHHENNIKETLISLIISFVMALIFRSYVVEAFVIPTGSMAPTLLGAHMHFRSAQNGYEWDVNPAFYLEDGTTPTQIQGAPGGYGPFPTDPMTTSQVNEWRRGTQATRRLHGDGPLPEPRRLLAGDRILVLKFLYELFPPKRWDVFVFKNPEDATENYIKRLIGLPNEQLWLADGDVFSRPIRKTPTGEVEVTGDWQIQRKPEHIQRTLWRTIYSSEYAPLRPERDGRRWFRDPWTGDQWQTSDLREYRCETSSPTKLSWNADDWPVWDWNPYNDYGDRHVYSRNPFPIADIRMRAGVDADDPASLTITARIDARRHRFEAIISPGAITICMLDTTDPSGQWRTLAEVESPRNLWRGVTDVEFWHVDQSLHVFVAGERVASGTYDWTPEQRLELVLGVPPEELAGETPSTNGFIDSGRYAYGHPHIEWEFAGSALTLDRVGLDRDLYYQPGQRYSDGPALATHPKQFASLGPREYFAAGDNSPNSKDSRLWESIDAEVARQIFEHSVGDLSPAEARAVVREDAGIVPRDLILGRAFFVYFPAPLSFKGRVPIPDFGRMRAIH